jgi:hypothetical protein
MSNLNSINSVLYRAEPSILIPGQGRKIEVEIYDSAAKVRHVSAYTFHPNKTTFWNCLKNWFIELFFGKTAVLVRVEGEPQALYMKVDDLSRVLNIPSKIIQRQTEKDASDFCVSHQIKQTIEKIQRLARERQIDWSQVEQKSIERVIEQVGYKNVFEIVDHKQFKTDLMIETLIKIGKQLAQSPSDHSHSADGYQFQVTPSDIYIWKIENDKKSKINLKTFEFNIENLSRPPHPLCEKKESALFSNKISSIFQTHHNKEKKEFENMAMALGVDGKNIKHLEALANRVGYLNLIMTIDRVEKEAKRVMMNTFIEIGQSLSTPAILDGLFAKFRLRYVGRKKVGNQQLTYAFAINKKDILINQGTIDFGEIKIVSDAIRLNNLNEPFVRIKINKKILDSTDNKVGVNSTKAWQAIDKLREEAKFLEKLHANKKEKSCAYIVLPFACEVMDNEKQMPVFFQKKYNGNGMKLRTAKLMHQLHALRDVAWGLDFIHRLGFVHMDVKPNNFLLEGDVESEVPVRGKVSDFGFTVEAGCFLPGGTKVYLPSEALLYESEKGEVNFKISCRVDKKIDSFSFGVTILEILNGLPSIILGLCQQARIDEEIQKYRNKLGYAYFPKEAFARLAVLDVAQALLQHDSTKRIDCAEAAARLDRILECGDWSPHSK